MSKWEELTGQFTAESDDGQRFEILVYTTFVEAGSFANRNAPPLEGRLKTIRTADGYAVNRIDDDNFEIVQLGLRVRRVPGG